MSDDAEKTRFPREVWDDFAMRAVLCGLVACAMWLPVGVGHVRAVDEIPALIACTLGALGLAVAVTVVVVLNSTRYRQLGLTVPATSSLFAGLLIMAVSGQAWPHAFGMIVGGYFLGLLAVLRKLLVLPAATEWEANTLTRARRFQTRYTTVFSYVGLAANVPPLACQFYRLYVAPLPVGTAAVAFWYMLTLSAILCVGCWLRFYRPFVELCLEAIGRVLYRAKATGVGLTAFPPVGPCLVIANHAFWFDPCVVAVSLPRPITAIMTEGFYKVWFLKPLLKYVFRVIVVPETPLKRETPELEQAVAALDRGEVVVIFPEGYLRRKEEVPLRRFGQGVWHILHARPETPVVACWVEGGWGSTFSYKNGPPMRNKPLDFRRPISASVSAAEAVPAEVLADQMATRIHLMNRVAAMRTVLGLEPLPKFEKPSVGDSIAGGDSGPGASASATSGPA